MSALPGNHYCLEHQGNSSHYDENNCDLCVLIAALSNMLALRTAPTQNAINPTFENKLVASAKRILAKARGEAC